MKAKHTGHTPLEHFNERPVDSSLDTIVIHSMCNPNEDCESTSISACLSTLDDHQVSAHYLIDREGNICAPVPEEKRAWHAGESQMPPTLDSRKGVNDFSIGIELLAKEEEHFTLVQYSSLVQLIEDIRTRHSIRFIVGHEDIAIPRGRKQDPGPKFDWQELRKAFSKTEIVFGTGNRSDVCSA